MRATPIRPRPQQQVSYDIGPFLGMHDGVDPSLADTRFARYLQNVVPENGVPGNALVGRPAMVARGGAISGAGQGVFQFDPGAAGTRKTVQFVAGRMYVYDWGAGTWSEPVTTANFTSAGITVSTSVRRIFCVMFGDHMVVTDSTNQPWMWDGGTGASSVTLLSNAPSITFGPAVVYYAKLFFIKRGATDYDRRTIIWSEEADPETGYEAGGFNNAWELRQSDENRLFGLYATNAGLYYFRRRSIGLIVGAVDDEFRTTGVHEAISESVGCPWPGSIVGTDTHIWFMDENRRPHAIRIGGDVEPVWADAANTIADATTRISPVTTTGAYNVQALVHPSLGLVLFGVEEDAIGNYPQRFLVFSSRTRRFLGVWTMSPRGTDAGGNLITGYWMSGGLVTNDDGEERLMVQPAGTGPLTFEAGTFTEGGFNIPHIVETAEFGVDQSTEQYFHRADLTFRDTSTVDIEAVTPAHTAASVGTLAVAAPAGGPTDNVKESIGLDEHARWLRLRLEHDMDHNNPLNEAFGFERARVEAIVDSSSPGVP